MGKGKIPIEKRFFINNVGLFLSAREKMLTHFKNKIFSVKSLDKIPTLAPTPKRTIDPTAFDTPEPAPDLTVFDTPKPRKTQIKKSQSKLREKFMNKIENYEKI